MAHMPLARQFQHVDMARQVGADIGVRVDQRITDTGLRAEVNDRLDHLIMQRRLDGGHVREIQFVEGEEPAMALAQRIEPRAFQRHGIIIVKIVDAHHGMALRHQPVSDMHADEPCRTGDQYRHAIFSNRDAFPSLPKREPM